MQTSIIVTGSTGSARLNGMLEKGWKVVSMCGMPSSCVVTRYGPDSTSHQYVDVTDHPPTCLVILEKNDDVVNT
jgi:hypothetical protein